MTTRDTASFDAVEQVLAVFPWLADLGPNIYDVLVTGVLANDPYDVIIANVRNTSEYKTRFAGLEKRRQLGLEAITEAEYLSTESGYWGQLREFNLLGTLGLTSESAFRKWAADRIGLDVSVQEINRRLDRGAALARDSGEQAKQLFTEWYGVAPSDDAILAYFLNPEQGLDIIEDQIAAAQVGGEAFRFGLNISRTRAEILRREGVTSAEMARQGFADVARELPVLSRLAQIHNTAPLSQQELEEFFFHEDPEVAARRNRTFTTALAAFQGAGATNVAREGGLGELVERNRAI
jgi:hypothetical protein